MNEFIHSHDRQVDRLPAQVRHADLSTVLCRDVSRSVQVRVQGEPARTTPENCAGTAVVLRCVSTARALLRGVSGINPDHHTTPFLGFVLYESSDLCERPTVQVSFFFCFFPPLYALLNAGQVFQDNGSTGRNRLNDLLRKNVIAISAEPRLGLADLFEVPLGALGPSGLKRSLQLEDPVLPVLPGLLPQEQVVRSDGGLCKTQVRANDVTFVRNLRSGRRYRNMQCPGTPQGNQLCCVYLVLNEFFRVRAYSKSDCLSTFNRGYADYPGLPVYFVGVCCVSRGAEGRLWQGGARSLLLQCQPFLYGFCGAHSCLDVEIAGKIWIFFAKRVVELVVQVYSVFIRMFPPPLTDDIKNFGKQSVCFLEERDLSFRGLKHEGDVASHMKILSYNLEDINKKEEDGAIFSHSGSVSAVC